MPHTPGTFDRRRTHCVNHENLPSHVDVQARPDGVLDLRVGGQAVAVLSPRQAEQVRRHLADVVAVILARTGW